MDGFINLLLSKLFAELSLWGTALDSRSLEVSWPCPWP